MEINNEMANVFEPGSISTPSLFAGIIKAIESLMESGKQQEKYWQYCQQQADLCILHLQRVISGAFIVASDGGTLLD